MEQTKESIAESASTRGKQVRFNALKQ